MSIQKTSMFNGWFETKYGKRSLNLAHKCGVVVSFNVILSHIVPAHLAANICEPAGWHYEFYRRTSVDQVFYSPKTGNIILIVEIQGRGHEKDMQKGRDEFKRRLLRLVDLEVVEVWYNENKKRIFEEIERKLLNI